MFSASGKRREMMKNLRKAQSLGVDISEVVEHNHNHDTSSNYFQNEDSDEDQNSLMSSSIQSDISASRSRSRSRSVCERSIPGYEKLKLMIEEDSLVGKVVRKIATVASRFRRDRDAVLISAFETSAMNYTDFRVLLKRMFFLDFTDEEYSHVVQLFDTNDDKEVSGSEFVICFTLLAKILRDKRRKSDLEKASLLRAKSLADEEVKRKSKEAYLYNAADYKFSEEDQASALQKVTHAAWLYDRTHHGARSLKQFDYAFLAPAEFRDSIKSTFDVSLTAKELGGLIMHFNKGKPGDINCSDFILWFLTTGYDYRLKKRTEQIIKTRSSSLEAVQEQEAKTKAQLEQQESKVDMNYTEDDTRSMMQKLLSVAAKYDKNHPSAPKLDGFSGNYMKPGLFREMLRRTFNIILTDKEAGALLHAFDPEKRGQVKTKEFLVFLVKAGYEERSRIRSHQIHAERNSELHQKEESERKILEQWRIDDENFDRTNFTREDRQSAIQKLTQIARGYHHDHASAPDLSVFNGAEIGPAEFREMVRRTMNIQFTYPEVASLYQFCGSKLHPEKIHTGIFLVKFKLLGNAEKDKQRRKQLERTQSAILRQKKEHEDKIQMALLKTNEIVDYNYTQADYDSAVKKMADAAHKYDKNHAGSASLDVFQGLNMTPGVFGKMIQNVLRVPLTGKELGALVNIYDANGDGVIDTPEFLSNFFMMQRAHRDEVRERRIQKIREQKERLKAELVNKARSQHSYESTKLKFTFADEQNLLKKLKQVGQLFALDNAPYVDHLQIFKGPAMSPSQFSDNFFRIFLVRLKFAEIGALMHKIDPKMASENLMNGAKFVTSLYKFSRLQEQVLLGKLDDRKITLDDLKITEIQIPNISPKRSTSKSPMAETTSSSFDDNSSVISDCEIKGSKVSRGIGPESSPTSNSFLPSLFINTDSSVKSSLFSPSSADLSSEISAMNSPMMRSSTADSYLSHGEIFSPIKSNRAHNSNSMLAKICGGTNPWLDMKPKAHRK